MTKEIELSQALSAKICHDLSGSIGTIDNCLGLLDNHNEAIKDKAKNLVSLESANLVSKIKFFRSAYGHCDGENKMSIVGVTKLLKDFLQFSHIELKLLIQEGILYLDSSIAKAIISLTSIAMDNINSSGEIVLEIQGNNEDVSITLQAKGKNLAINEESLRILSNNAKSRINVKNCREHYIKGLLAKVGYGISLNMDANSMKYIVYSEKL